MCIRDSEKAIEAVQKWRFKPGQKDGQAVPTYANAEFQFRLGGKPGSDLAAGVGGGIGAGAVNLPLDDQTVLRSGTFHLSEEGNSDSATWGVVYGLKGRYTVRPREVLVTLEVGLAITPHPVKVSPCLLYTSGEVPPAAATFEDRESTPASTHGGRKLVTLSLIHI